MWNVVDIWQGACYQNILFPRLWENWIRSHSFWHPLAVWDRFDRNFGLIVIQALGDLSLASGSFDSI